MKDRTLIKISLAWSIVGIFVLILAVGLLAPQHIQLSEMERNIGKTVLIQGEITKTRRNYKNFCNNCNYFY